MTTTIDLVGFVAAALTTFAFLPQVIKTWTSQSARDLSLPMLLAMVSGITLWLAYGWALDQAPLIVANGVTLCLVLVLLYMKLREMLAARS